MNDTGSISSCCRGKYPPASEYLSYADKSTISLVEVFRNIQLEEEQPLENGALDHEVCDHF